MVSLIIALIEDSKHARVIKKSLRDAGHQVTVVDCYSKAKVLLETRCFASGKNMCDLIISEVHLENGGSVFDFLRWVKEDPRLRTIPFVFLSVEPTELARYLRDGVRIAARVLGSAKYISMDKFDEATLHAELAALLPPTDATLVIPQKPGE